MNNEYKTEYDKIALTEAQKTTLIAKMKDVERNIYEAEKESYNQYKVLFKAVAACLAVAIIIGGTYIGSIFSTSNENVEQDTTTPKNSFMITANAAGIKAMPEDAICIFSGVSESGFMMKDTYFFIHELTGLTVEGTNIEKISMMSNKKLCYFSVDNNKSFSNCNTLTNSQFTLDEIEINGKICDGFTFTNPNPTGKKQIINLGGMVEFILESDKADKEMVSWLEEAYSLNMEQWEVRAKQRDKYGEDAPIPISDEEQKLSDEMDYRIRQVFEKTLRDATVIVEITFTDGTIQTQNLDIDFIMQDYEGNIIFDPRKNSPEDLDMKTKEGYEWIAFRYSK